MKKWSSDPLGFGGHGSHPFHSGWRWTHHTKKGHQNYQVLYKSWRFFPKLEASATFASHKKRRYLNLMKSWFPPKKKHDLQASTKKHGKIELLEIHTYFVCVSSYCFLWGRIHYIILYTGCMIYVYICNTCRLWACLQVARPLGVVVPLRNAGEGGYWNRWSSKCWCWRRLKSMAYSPEN